MSEGSEHNTCLLSIAIIARDEAHHIRGCLESITAFQQLSTKQPGFTTEVVVLVDHRTRDQTAAICASSGARVVIEPWRGYAAQRNRALDLCRGEWVLFVDADERVSPELRHELYQLRHDGLPCAWARPLAMPGAWESGPIVGYAIPRYNLFFGKVVWGGGWYPDYQLRLLRRSHARYNEQHYVHEVAQLRGRAGRLSGHLWHINIERIGEFWEKQVRYALAEAQMLAHEGRVGRWRHFIGGPVREFWRRYGVLGGWRDGLLGLFLCGAMAWFELVKFACLFLINPPSRLGR